MSGDWRLLTPGEETDRAIVAARLDFESRYAKRFGYMPPQQACDLWWPLGGDSPWNGSTSE